MNSFKPASCRSAPSHMFFWIQLADLTAAEKKKKNNNNRKQNCDEVKVGLNEFFPRGERK
jgi:hypothetical protein